MDAIGSIGGGRVRLNSTEKRKRRQRNQRFANEQEKLAKSSPPQKKVAWYGGTIQHNKDVALLAYLQLVVLTDSYSQYWN
jgi:hypothetical protein